MTGEQIAILVLVGSLSFASVLVKRGECVRLESRD